MFKSARIMDRLRMALLCYRENIYVTNPAERPDLIQHQIQVTPMGAVVRRVDDQVFRRVYLQVHAQVEADIRELMHD